MDSYETIMQNIDDCKDIIPFNIRVNVDKENMNSVGELWPEVIKRKWHEKLHVAPAAVGSYNEQCGLAAEACLSGEEFAQVCKEQLTCFYEAGVKIPAQLLIPAKRKLYCTAVGYGSFVVDPDGYLYTCWNVIGRKEKSVGNIVQGNPMNVEFMKWLLHEPAESCQTCNLLPICSGGCPYFFFEGGKAVCDNVKFTFHDNLKLLHKIYCDEKGNSQSKIAGEHSV